MKILVTGAAGFIGMHVSARLLELGYEVVGVDNLNDYYDVSLKEARLKILVEKFQLKFFRINLADEVQVIKLFKSENFNKVIHLAAQAGVRHSLKTPNAYISANIQSFMHILESCRNYQIDHLVYASSSSVYGGNTKLPFSESDNVDHPESLYAATKKANELMAHTYSSLYGIPTTGLRFFTVYGPWGRPDMAPILFSKAIIRGEVIKVFNYGNLVRDFTYIDDIVEGVVRVVDKPATCNSTFKANLPDPSMSYAPYRIFNIGNGQPKKLMEFISNLELALNKKALKEFLPMQAGDVKATYADTSKLNEWIGFKPNTPLDKGVVKFVDWFLDYYY